jgi:hypothetical protein
MHPHQPAASRPQVEGPIWEGRTGHCDRCPHCRAAAAALSRHWIAPQRLPELLTQRRPDSPAMGLR